MKDIRLFTSQPVAKFYDSLFLRLDLSFVQEPSLEAGLDEEIAYTKELLSVLEEGIAACGDKKIQDLAERIRGLLDTDKIREIRAQDTHEYILWVQEPSGNGGGKADRGDKHNAGRGT